MARLTSANFGRTSPASSEENTLPPTPDLVVDSHIPVPTVIVHDSECYDESVRFDLLNQYMTADTSNKTLNNIDDRRFRTSSLHIQSLPNKLFCETCGSIDTETVRSSLDTNSRSTNITPHTDLEDLKQVIPVAVGFWDPALSSTRREVLLRYCKTLVILCIAIFSILSIYWGVLVDVKDNLHRATVAVVNFEGQELHGNFTPIVGPFIQRAVEAEIANRPDHLGFRFFTASDFDNDPEKVRLAVFNQKHWAAIIVYANATSSLIRAVQTGDSSYNPSEAALIVYEQARDIESYNFYIIPVLNRLSLTMTSSFASFWAKEVFSNPAFNPAIYQNAPQAVSPGISFEMLDLRPFDPPSAIPTITIGLIYLIIIAFFSFTFFVPTHAKFVAPNPASPHPPLKFWQHIIYRWCATITAYFFLSLAYSLVSLAFLIPFSNQPPSPGGKWSPIEGAFNANPFGHGTFLAYWLLNFVGMAALGLPCENMAMLLSALSPLPYSALFLIWWVITNVSTGFYALEIASDFYRWGYAWPLRQIVEGSKTLVFGTKSHLKRNFGVLFVWIVISTLLFPIACWVMRWKSTRARTRATG